MFIPLHDTNALKYIRLQYVTITLIVVNCLIWFFTGLVANDSIENHAIAGFGFIPAVAFHSAVLDPSLTIVPANWTFITYAFLHNDFMHLATNMVFLWVFGDNVEDALGHFRYLIFFMLCAAAGALVHALIAPSSQGPLIGASGAVSGVIVAYFMLHPRVRVWVLVLFRIPLPLPAFIPLAFWICQQFYFLVVDRGGEVSWGAHVGGILSGAFLVLFFRRKGVPLFDRAIVSPKAVVHVEEPSSAPAPEEGSGSKTYRGPWGRG